MGEETVRAFFSAAYEMGFVDGTYEGDHTDPREPRWTNAQRGMDRAAKRLHHALDTYRALADAVTRLQEAHDLFTGVCCSPLASPDDWAEASSHYWTCLDAVFSARAALDTRGGDALVHDVGCAAPDRMAVSAYREPHAARSAAPTYRPVGHRPAVTLAGRVSRGLSVRPHHVHEALTASDSTDTFSI